MTPVVLGPGAHLVDATTTLFRVWAPNHETMSLRVDDRSPVAMMAARNGYFELAAEAPPGTRYQFVLPGGDELPDPASRSQPDGVHGPSEVVDPSFEWTDGDWTGVPPGESVYYELHVGTFTAAGTFEAIIPELPRLKALGITLIELLPIAQFPGRRNWGYDGVYPYAAQQSYGGLRGLQRLVDACHGHGIGVALDVVHNHLGPEGNYAARFGPYFTNDYRTPWGAALNFDGRGSDEVREFFIRSAIFWMQAAHIDALRLDAAHTIRDAYRAISFLEDLSSRVREAEAHSGRSLRLIAETSLNDSRYLQPVDEGGRGLDGQWNDDFQHALHALLTGERAGYYIDYGDIQSLVRCYAEGYRFQGEPSKYYGRRHGRPSTHIDPSRLVVFDQNHDQVGNRPWSDRLAAILDFESLKLAAAAVILSPYVPLIFMGEEWGEVAPFWFFVDHGDPALVDAIRRGRTREYAAMGLTAKIADPGSPATFEACRIDPRRGVSGQGLLLQRVYAELFRLRKSEPLLYTLTRDGLSVAAESPTSLVITRQAAGDLLALHLNFAHEPQAFPAPAGSRVLFDSAANEWGGPGTQNRHTAPFMQAPRSAMLVRYPEAL